jgi:catechol 2,3-dioxygenase-like lactoylglutathione lyase family enzyme
MNITESLHTAILVTDLEKAVNFYENVLGLTRIDRPLQYDGVWYQVGDYQIHLRD